MKNLVFIVATFLLFASCQKEEKCITSTLPKVTTTGANTMGCIWDGEVWSPYKEEVEWATSLDLPALYTDYYPPDRHLAVYGNRWVEDECNTKQGHMSVAVRYDASETITEFSLIALGGNNNNYLIDSTKFFEVNIHRFDRISRIFSAEFNGTMTDRDTGESIKITDFRVDVPF